MRRSMLTLAAIACSLAISSAPTRGQSGDGAPPISTMARTVRFASPALGYEYTFAILLPQSYMQNQKRYPVLYLLHPGGGSHASFPARTWFNRNASSRDMIVVLPNGNRSFFVNSVSAPTARFEDVIVKDLVEYVDAHYRTIPAREGRAIAGISMGGFGATVLGLRHPELFRTVGALSASLGSARSDAASETTAGTQMIFGRPFTAERRQRDPLALVAEVAPDSAPYFYVSCGAEDAFLPVNRQFVQQLAERRFQHEYREVPGGHTWDVWDAQLPEFFDVLFGQSGWRSR